MKTKKLNPVMIVFVIVLVLVLGVCVFFATRQPNGEEDTQGSTEFQGSEVINSESESEPDTDTETEPDAPEGSAEGTETFAIFGVDSRTNQLGKGTRSDSIMLVYVNHDEGTVKVASIYRDCMVHIEGKGYEKITHAHGYGGPALAISTINENFDLNIEKYVTVNFNAMTELVDSLGGVEVELTDKEAEAMKDERFTGAGTYLLDGSEALKFSRIRKIDTDYKRTERQREVLFKIFEKSKDLSYGEKFKLVENMLEKINTNYSQDEILVLLYSLSKYEITEMGAFPQVFYGGTVEGAWVEVPCTLIDMNAALHEFLYGTTEYTPSEKVEEYSAVIRQKVDGPNHDMRK